MTWCGFFPVTTHITSSDTHHAGSEIFGLIFN